MVSTTVNVLGSPPADGSHLWTGVANVSLNCYRLIVHCSESLLTLLTLL